MILRTGINLQVVTGAMKDACKQWLIDGHYLHTVPDPRTRPLCYCVDLSGYLVGTLWFGRPESTCCYSGGLTYGSSADVARGRATFDRWEVLNLSRVWLHPDFQPGGVYHRNRSSPDDVISKCTPAALIPGFFDRKGLFRSTLASTVIRAALARIGFDYLRMHPPCFVDQPYQIRAVLSYCDTRLHRGAIYRAAGFELARRNRAGIETWWTPAVSPLSAMHDRRIRELASVHPRSVRIREAAAQR